MARTADPTVKISLLRAAEEVFSERGLDATKVEEITRRAGHSKGAFYLHFDSKEALFKQVVESFLARLGGLYRSPDHYEKLPDSPAEMLSFWLERDIEMFEFLWQNRAIVAILAACQGANTYLLEAFHEGVRATCRLWVESAKARRLLRVELDTELTATLLWGAYHELSRRMVSSPKRPPIEGWLRQTLVIFMRGLGTPRLIEATASFEKEIDQRVMNHGSSASSSRSQRKMAIARASSTSSTSRTSGRARA